MDPRWFPRFAPKFKPSFHIRLQVRTEKVIRRNGEAGFVFIVGLSLSPIASSYLISASMYGSFQFYSTSPNLAGDLTCELAKQTM